MLHFVDLLLFHLSTRPMTSELPPWLNKLSRNCIRVRQIESIRYQNYLRIFLSFLLKIKKQYRHNLRLFAISFLQIWQFFASKHRYFRFYWYCYRKSIFIKKIRSDLSSTIVANEIVQRRKKKIMPCLFLSANYKKTLSSYCTFKMYPVIFCDFSKRL